ncbi:MAG: carboxypeptidase regulatory-like domain-containing protein [Armatimonadota bacterium]
MIGATARGFNALLLTVSALALVGCGGAVLVAYTGGGLPPGEPDLGGIVVAAVDEQVATAQAVDTAQGDVPPGTEPVEGADVLLTRGRDVVGRATSGPGGYFRFERPATGNYTLQVTPPASRPDLRPAQRQVSHVRGRRTFVTIQLERVGGDGPPSDAGPAG